MTNLDMLNAIAGGDIRPNRFVKASTAADNTVLECNAGDQPIGITTSSTIDYTSDNHATSTAGEDSVSLQPGRVHEVVCGGTITRGDYVVPNADGDAITSDEGSWIATESGADGEIIRVLWLGGKGTPTRFATLEHFTAAATTLTRAESGKVCTNLGAGTAIEFTLPQDAVVGDFFEFVVMAAQSLRISPGAAGAIYESGAKGTDDKWISANDEGESVKLVCDGNSDWVALYLTGTWTNES